jgi:START domain
LPIQERKVQLTNFQQEWVRKGKSIQQQVIDMCMCVDEKLWKPSKPDRDDNINGDLKLFSRKTTVSVMREELRGGKSIKTVCYKIWKCVININASAAHVTSILADFSKIGLWNEYMKEIKIVEQIDAATDIVWYALKVMAKGLLPSRDFSVVRRAESFDDCSLIVSTAVIHPKSPVTKEFTRGVNEAGGFLITPISQSQCRVIWINNVDAVLDLVPNFLIDPTTRDVMRAVARSLMHFAEKKS